MPDYKFGDEAANPLYANAHRGKVRKASLLTLPLRLVEAELRRIPSQGWAEMIRKAYEVDPMVCPKCGGTMKVVAFLTEHAVVDRSIPVALIPESPTQVPIDPRRI